LKIGPNFFLQHFKTKILYNFVKICGYIKRYDINFFLPLSFVAVFGSGIRDPGSGMGKNQDPGSGINIPDPQHCFCFSHENKVKNCGKEHFLYFNTWILMDPDPQP
jgi:hypothetical protein